MDLPSTENEDGDRNAVVIADIPVELDQEDLELHLTNERLGGGDIDDIQLDALAGTARVKFADPEGMSYVYVV